MNVDVNPRKLAAIAFFVLFALYALFQARFLILGPQVVVTSPKDNETVHDPVLIASGGSHNVVFLSLDDRQIYTDKEGHWQEKLILSPGLNIIKLVARDRFGRETEKLFRVVLN